MRANPVEALSYLDWEIRGRARLDSSRIEAETLASWDEEYRKELGPHMGFVVDSRILEHAYRAGRLVLVCGAGVSAAHGVPTWKDLVLACLRLGETRASKADQREIADARIRLEAKVAYEAEDLVRATQALEQSTGSEFQNLIREILYGYPKMAKTDWQKSIPGELHRAIAGLGYWPWNSSPKPGLAALVTYNFDDLLEAAYRWADRPVAVWSSIRGEFQPATVGDHDALEVLNIWHPHGWLPRLNLARRSDPGRVDMLSGADVVFSELAFERNYGQDHSFTRQFYALWLHDTPLVWLFIGCSLTDKWTLERLAAEAIPYCWHYTAAAHPSSITDPLQQFTWFENESHRLESANVRVCALNGYSSLPGWLSSIGTRNSTHKRLVTDRAAAIFALRDGSWSPAESDMAVASALFASLWEPWTPLVEAREMSPSVVRARLDVAPAAISKTLEESSASPQLRGVLADLLKVLSELDTETASWELDTTGELLYEILTGEQY